LKIFANSVSGLRGKRIYYKAGSYLQWVNDDRSFTKGVCEPMASRILSAKTTWTALAVMGMITLAPGRAHADQITGIVSFGDSLSDVGNDYIASGGTQPAPAADYYQGRFTNGGNWLDYLAHDLGVAAPVASIAGGSDYAFGGASTGSGTTTYAPGQAVPNVDTQIAMYLSKNTPTSTQLFTIWAGANNLLIGNQSNPTVPAQDIAHEITTLAAAGAKQFLIPNLPLLGAIPASSGLTSAQQQSLNAWSIGFNQTLQAEATSLQSSLGVQIHLVNIQGLLQNVLANPADYGFTNVTGSAINSSLAGNGYLFWDAEHPTTAADALIAEVAAQSIPEPSMFLIFATSIGFLAAARHRKKVSVAGA
jgi:phospholipase/lecithinase/hemolysin